jgi:hypothetical protein
MYPHDWLFEEKMVSLSSQPKEIRKLRVIFLIASRDQIEIILMIFLLVYNAVVMEGLKLVADHKTLDMRLCPLHYLGKSLHCNLIVINWEIGCPSSSVIYLPWKSDDIMRLRPLISGEEYNIPIYFKLK